MRTIKFRGKRLDNGTWETGGIAPLWIGTSRETWHIVDKVTGYLTPVDPTTAGQFTGLFDKNGTEIYEGDIVRWGHANDYSREIPHRKAVVKLFPALHFEIFTNTEFGTPHEFHYGNFSYKDTHKHLEIIGSIHDNPELLKNE